MINLKNVKKINETKKDLGITLIALVVTIIVLLILAGISIMMLTGNNGILQKATTAKENTNSAQISERIKLAELSARTDGQGFLTYSNLNTELTKEFGEKGIGYNISDESENPWKIIVGDVEYDINHAVAPAIQPGESGYAGGYYDDPYIPVNFEHKAGTTTDWNAGYTIIGKTGTDNAGDEFVWVPCVLDQSTVKEGDTVQTFTKITTGKYANNGIEIHPSGGINSNVSEEDDTVEEIKTSVEKYGGFYIAKYEAGIAGTTDNWALTTKTAIDGSVKPLSQAGIGVWNGISRTNSLTVAKAMIPTSTGTKSTLMSGECWDTTLAWITATADSSYAENSAGKGWYNAQPNITGYYGNNTNNIFDMGGNVDEYTSENCFIHDEDGDTYGVVSRGGSYINSGSDSSAANRRGNFGDGFTTRPFGFRVMLYKPL